MLHGLVINWSGFCGMLHGLVINWSSSAIETSRNRVNVFSIITVSFMRILGLREVASTTARIALEFTPDYAFSVSLLLTPLCCDDIHDVTPRVSALAGCESIVIYLTLILVLLIILQDTDLSEHSSLFSKKFRMGVAIATGRRGYYKPGTRAWVSRISRKIRIPISMYPCRVEERLTIELAEGREVEKIVKTVTKTGVWRWVTRYPKKFQEYQLTDKEKEIERMMIYWEQVEYEVSDDDDSDLKSTARSVPKDYELEDTGGSSGI
ncbi:hypothetical protein Tco_1419005 [Tanacetum coccineum]